MKPSRCRLSTTSRTVCEKIDSDLMEIWVRFLDDKGEKTKSHFHLNKALRHHMTVYKHDFHNRLTLYHYMDGAEIIKKNESIEDCIMIFTEEGCDISFCSSISPQVRDEWKRFITEYDLADVNVYHIERAILNYIELWTD